MDGGVQCVDNSVAKILVAICFVAGCVLCE